MPLEISEISLRMAVGTSSPSSGGGETGCAGNGNAAPAPGLPPGRMDELVDLCVRRVLLTLKAREER